MKKLDHFDLLQRALVQANQLEPSVFDGEKISETSTREWWRHVSNCLRALAIGAEQNPERLIAQNMPIGLLLRLSLMAADLGDGRVSPIIKRVLSKGRLVPDRFERDLIIVAVTYMHLVKMKLIIDDDCSQRIMNAYGVANVKTLQDWYKKYRGAAILEGGLTPDEVQERLERAGMTYQTHRSRTAAGISKKDKKRSPKPAAPIETDGI